MTENANTEDATTEDLEWHKILEPGELDEGRVKTVGVGTKTFAVSHYDGQFGCCLLYTSPSPRDQRGSRMPSSA